MSITRAVVLGTAALALTFGVAGCHRDGSIDRAAAIDTAAASTGWGDASTPPPYVRHRPERAAKRTPADPHPVASIAPPPPQPMPSPTPSATSPGLTLADDAQTSAPARHFARHHPHHRRSTDPSPRTSTPASPDPSTADTPPPPPEPAPSSSPEPSTGGCTWADPTCTTMPTLSADRG